MAMTTPRRYGAPRVRQNESLVFLFGLLCGAIIVFALNLEQRSSLVLIPPKKLMIKNNETSQTTPEGRPDGPSKNTETTSTTRTTFAEKLVTPTTTTGTTLTSTTSKNVSETTETAQGMNFDLDKIRIFCMILTQPANNATKAKAVKETWGRRCGKLLFVSSVEDKELGAIAPPHVQDGRVWIWAKTKGALEYIWNNFGNDFDWFLKADDDTYVIMESVRELLANYKATEPLYIGTIVGGDPYNSAGYMYGGAGYILSHRTLERFMKEAVPNETICEPAVTKVRLHYRGDEDVELGRCLHNIGGVQMIIPKDSKGHGRFLSSNPDHHTEANDLPESEGPTGFVDTALSFHYVEPKQQYFIEYLLYHVKLPNEKIPVDS